MKWFSWTNMQLELDAIQKCNLFKPFMVSIFTLKFMQTIHRLVTSLLFLNMNAWKLELEKLAENNVYRIDLYPMLLQYLNSFVTILFKVEVRVKVFILEVKSLSLHYLVGTKVKVK